MKLSEFYEKYGDQNINEKELKEFLGIKEHKHFKPRYKETYFFVCTDGAIYRDMWTDDEIDYKFYQNNELYRTEEEAEFARDKNKFLLKMQRDFEDNSDVMDWEDDEQSKYYLFYDYRKREVTLSYLNSHKGFDLITTNKEWLHQYIKENEEEIKKHYFEIEE